MATAELRSPFSVCALGTGILLLVYVRMCVFKMPQEIANSIDCEKRFPKAKDIKTAEIHWKISEVYGENTMSDRIVQKWVRAFKDDRTNVRYCHY